MSGTILAAAMLSLGIGYGYQPLPDGKGYEYIIQIKPEDLAAMKSGQDTYSDIPPNLRGVRSFRITLRTDPVPQTGTPEPTEIATPAPAAPAPAPSAATTQPNRSPSDLASGSVPEQKALFPQNASAENGPTPAPQPKDQEPKKPWAPFLLALAVLVASLGCNLFLGWITLETRSRYRRLLRPGDEEPLPDQVGLPEEDDPFRDLEDLDGRE